MTSKMTAAGIVITQGDTLNVPLRFSLNQENGKMPADISNAVVRMQVRSGADVPPLIRKEIIDHYDPVNGKTILQLTSEDTNIPVGTYFTDIEIQFIDGQKFTFYPPKAGSRAYFKITEQFTKGD